ncbi:MAG: hypothetical protein R2824_03035 [Saprospiraceae bacterium]|nr:hypothetical protein [Lewinella sp.]
MDKPIQNIEQDFELIGRFHDFALTEAELAAFEERLENDPVFQERFRLYGEMEHTIEVAFPSGGEEKVKNQFPMTEQTENSKPREGKIRLLSNRRMVSLAAAVALLLVAGLWWLLQGPSLESPQTLAAYYWDHTDKSHLFESVQRGEGPPDHNEPARNFFRSLQPLQESGQYNIMIDQLEIYKQTTKQPIPFEDDADWLMAIAFVGNNDLPRARTQLEMIKERYPARSRRAEELLDQIGKLEAQ